MTDTEIDNLVVFVLGHGMSNASREAVRAALAPRGVVVGPHLTEEQKQAVLDAQAAERKAMGIIE